MEREIRNAPQDMLLVMVDIDDCPALRNKYHANGVPKVVAFVNGREVDQFSGEHDEAFVRQFLASIPAPN